MSEHKFNFVEDYPKLKTIKDAKAWICTNDPDFKPDPILPLLPLKDAYMVLDFGCGIGRNVGMLAELTSADIVCYDHPNMTDLAKQYLKPDQLKRIAFLNPPIAELLRFRYDFVISTLVFMHMRISELESVIPIIAHSLTDNGLMYVHCRKWTDDDQQLVWPLILRHFEVIQSFTPKIDLEWKEGLTADDIEFYAEPKVLLRARK